MPRPFLTLLSLSICASGCLAPARTAAPGPEPGARVDTLIFDDFSGTSLNRTRWNVLVTGVSFGTVNDEQQAYVDSPETLSLEPDAPGARRGALVLEARLRPGTVAPDGRTYDFTSARIDTRDKVSFTYGTAAARMKLPAGAGFWPAFWALGAGPWPDTGEVDIMESVGEADWTGVALHGPGYSGETPLVNKAFFPDGEDATGWHVYSVTRTREALTFRVDGRTAYRATRPMVEHYGAWAFDDPKFLILNLALGGAYPVKTNGVATPYPGIPPSTVDAIRAGRGRMLVDWVLVTSE